MNPGLNGWSQKKKIYIKKKLVSHPREKLVYVSFDYQLEVMKFYVIESYDTQQEVVDKSVVCLVPYDAVAWNFINSNW